MVEKASGAMAGRGAKTGELVETGGFVGTNSTLLSFGVGSMTHRRHRLILKNSFFKKSNSFFICLLCRAE